MTLEETRKERNGWAFYTYMILGFLMFSEWLTNWHIAPVAVFSPFMVYAWFRWAGATKRLDHLKKEAKKK